MDLVTNIEMEMENVLKEIDVLVPAPSGYVYNNTVTIVNTIDEAPSLDYGSYPFASIVEAPDEEVKDHLANAYMNLIRYKIVGMVALENEDDNPTFNIRRKMNEFAEDVKAAFGNNSTINCSCDNSHIKRVVRVYNKNNDMFRVGQVEVYIDIQYSQLKANPNNRCIV